MRRCRRRASSPSWRVLESFAKSCNCHSTPRTKRTREIQRTLNSLLSLSSLSSVVVVLRKKVLRHRQRRPLIGRCLDSVGRPSWDRLMDGWFDVWIDAEVLSSKRWKPKELMVMNPEATEQKRAVSNERKSCLQTNVGAKEGRLRNVFSYGRATTLTAPGNLIQTRPSSEMAKTKWGWKCETGNGYQGVESRKLVCCCVVGVECKLLA